MRTKKKEIMEKLLRDWSTKQYECTKCKILFTKLDNWNKACRVHLGDKNLDFPGVNWGPYHWDCCGASWIFGDKHYEFDVPRGCYYMDHTVLFKPYSSQDNNFLAVVPIAFEPQMKTKKINRENIVATILSPNDEKKHYYCEDEKFNEIQFRPTDVPNELDDVEDEDDERSYYDEPKQFNSYYIVRRIITERQDEDRVKYYLEKNKKKSKFDFHTIL